MRPNTYISFFKQTIAVPAFLLSVCGCNKLVEVPPPVSSLTGATVYNSDATAAGVLTGLYTNMSSGNLVAGMRGISLESGLSADELTLYDNSSDVISNMLYKNDLSNQQYVGPWKNAFTYLETVNSALEGINTSTSLTPAVKQQLLGESKFIRAFLYFYLVNIYGDVPLITTSDYLVNAKISRTPVSDVYKQIITDLQDAKNLLSINFLGPDIQSIVPDRVRPTKWAAAALLARTYLYKADWVNAEKEADSVIGNTGSFELVKDLNSVFLSNCGEAIWQLMPVNTGHNTEDGFVFIINNAPNSRNPVYLSNYILNAFEPGDQRRINWVDSVITGGNVYYYPYKYKSGQYGAPLTEYLMVLRLAETYLIRSEARAQQGNTVGSKSDLDSIRTRAGLPPSNASSQLDLLTAIQHERQVELFTEWGHRWLDMKRTLTIDNVMGTGGVCAAKGGTWNSSWQLYPIQINDLRLDPNLKQNPGY